MDRETMNSINDALSHPGLKTRLKGVWPGWVWTISGVAVISGAIEISRTHLGIDELGPIISALLASYIAMLALGAIVVTLLWPQYNDAIDRMQDFLKDFAEIAFEQKGNKIRILEFLPLAMKRLEEADGSAIKAIWKNKYRDADAIVLQLIRYVYSLSWYVNAIPINHFKSELQKNEKFSHLLAKVDVEVTMKSIAIRLMPEVLLQMQLDLFNPANYFFAKIDGEFPADLNSALYYRMIISGYVSLRLRVLSYLSLTSRTAYTIYILLIVELAGLICVLQKSLAEHIWLSKSLMIGFLFLATLIVVVLINLLLPTRSRANKLT